eukprot:gb/GECH01011928.1/.p1 GENE.gb/GECH01011928.1/~~gb/GECH01011928.1/.p1  ORF type:complete len:488 (+),score=87.31 gb/GECH01011928.1/:1-1464(+)
MNTIETQNNNSKPEKETKTDNEGFLTEQFFNPRNFTQLKKESPSPNTSKDTIWSRSEVARHNTRDDAWFIIHDKVYDLTNFLHRHPGGYAPMGQAGKDATDEFEAYHPPGVKRSYYQIGVIKPEERRYQKGTDESPQASGPDSNRDPIESNWCKMREEVERKYSKPDWSYYYIKFGIVAVLFLASAASILYTRSVVGGSLSVAALGGFFIFLARHQAALLGHDFGHNGVAKDHEQNGFLGAISTNLMNGVSISWWRWSHDVHHLNTNSADHDLDITHLPFFCLSKHMFNFPEFDMIAKMMVPYQHIMYIPIMFLVARLNLQAQSAKYILQQKLSLKLKTEIALILGYVAYSSIFLYMLPDWSHRIIFTAVAYFLSGILHVQITLSHWPLPMHKGVTDKSFVESQIATSQNIITYWWNDWFYGGLNYQIEHHLFPRIPRNKLRTIRKEYVKPFCEKHNLPYQEVGFIEGIQNLWHALRQVSSQYTSSQ